jgi:cell division transport system permease protein
MRRFDLPLEQTAAGRLMPWLMGGLVYLAVVALAVAALADGALRLYHLRAKLVTVTLPSVDDGIQGERDLAAALDVLRQTQGVTSATPVAADELAKLIEPLIGGAQSGMDLPLPRLIDVTLDPLADLDLPALQERLRDVVAGATLGVEAMSRDRAERVAGFVRVWGGGLGLALLLTLLVAVALLTRLALSVQTSSIELLRCMGAPDGYLARQFERQALVTGLWSALPAFALAMLTVLVVLYSGQTMQLVSSVELGLRPIDWIVLACVPLAAILLVTAIARLSALWSLRRIS